MRPFGRRTAAVVTAVLAFSSLPAHAVTSQTSSAPPAGRAPIGVTGSVQQLGDYVRRGFNHPQAVLLHELDTLAASGVHVSVLQPRITRVADKDGIFCTSLAFGFAFTFDGSMQAAGDLNADGRPDVLENHYAERTNTTRSWVVTARDGRTGHRLWSHQSVLTRDAYGIALPMKLSGGRSGALELHYDFTETQQVTGLSVGISSVEGHGHRLWRHVYSGTIRWSLASGSLTFTHAPLTTATAQLRHGAEDVLVTMADTAGGKSTRSLLRLSGVDGSVARILNGVSGDLGLAPDQDGDGYVDLWSATLGSSPSLAAHKGSTGKQIWSNTTLPLSTFIDVKDAGVVVGGTAARHDLAVTTLGPTDGTAVDTPIGFQGGQVSNLVALVTGGTGALAWTKPGGDAYPLRRAGAGLTAVGALGVATLTEVQTGMSVQLVETIATYDGHGAPVTAQRYTYDHDTGDCGAGSAIVVPWDGDVDSDGALEGEVDFFIFDGTNFDADQQIIRGSDGAVLFHATDWTLGGSVDGHGDDRWTDSGGPGRVVLTVRRGDTDKALWSHTFAVAGLPFGAEAYAVPVTSSRCQDVAVVAYGQDSTTAALLASSGEAWWSVRYGMKDTKGKLTTGRVTHRLC